MVNLRRTYNEPYQRIVSFLLPIIMKNKIQWDVFFVWAVALSISGVGWWYVITSIYKMIKGD
jgi:hypothetical protein